MLQAVPSLNLFFSLKIQHFLLLPEPESELTKVLLTKKKWALTILILP